MCVCEFERVHERVRVRVLVCAFVGVRVRVRVRVLAHLCVRACVSVRFSIDVRALTRPRYCASDRTLSNFGYFQRFFKNFLAYFWSQPHSIW